MTYYEHEQKGSQCVHSKN